MSRPRRIAALGTVVDLVFAERVSNAFLDAVAEAWSRCVADSSEQPIIPTSSGGGQVTVVTPPDDSHGAIRSALQRLSHDVTHSLITAQTGNLLMLHAGAVSHPASGASAVFVAPSGTGKTTMSRLLGRCYGYITDETVGIDPVSGRIFPYTKPLSIVCGAGRLKAEISPDTLALLHHHDSPHLSRIVILDRQPGQSEAMIDELDVLAGISALVPESSALNRLPRPLNSVAELIEATGPVLRITYSEAVQVLPVVLDLLGEPA